MAIQHQVGHALETSTLADILERVLDKGIVIAGDIKVKIVDIELLTIQIRLVICSVDKAKEMGLDWWVNKSIIDTPARPELPAGSPAGSMVTIEERLARLEASLPKAAIPLA